MSMCIILGRSVSLLKLDSLLIQYFSAMAWNAANRTWSRVWNRQTTSRCVFQYVLVIFACFGYFIFGWLQLIALGSVALKGNQSRFQISCLNQYYIRLSITSRKSQIIVGVIAQAGKAVLPFQTILICDIIFNASFQMFTVKHVIPNPH